MFVFALPPGHASRIRGRYALLVVNNYRAKMVQRAWSERLAGPWTLESKPIIEPVRVGAGGRGRAARRRHRPQARPDSEAGRASGSLGERLGGRAAAPARPRASLDRHRQRFAERAGPGPSLAAEEPAPSLGGFAVCDEERPVAGWRWCDASIEWIADLPETARANGEGTNLWRHYALAREDGRIGLFYNSGSYFAERLYLKLAACAAP